MKKNVSTILQGNGDHKFSTGETLFHTDTEVSQQ